ncbi:hypothetical protein Rsub_12609 [Raphidocelis subcapitata]|uniref:Sulfotransferase n=1 Tax=Raphidocelis subcapitata TaxID=307507 RepID=A0A2V0PLM6_9CHLO|nr:hypothetical protein Rsub_12609 [Raphidocelis subcapitata]|eukprot:GBF98963.1 hypothetical protein Rsub_12609 [Raphidocelis subcapitata]
MAAQRLGRPLAGVERGLLIATVLLVLAEHSLASGSFSGGGDGGALLGGGGAARHACGPTFLTPHRAEPATGFRFLHIPKTGTSFIITLRNQLEACRHKDISCLGMPGGGHRVFRNGLKTSDAHVFFSRPPPGFDSGCGGRLLACQHEIYHVPYEQGWQARNPSFAYATFIREPVAQTISMIMWQCPEARAGTEEGWAHCLQSNWTQTQGQVGFRPRHDPHVKMLLGSKIVARGGKPLQLSAFNLTTALTNLLRLDFFGLTDRWAESICLFHATFGGEPRPSAFLNTRPGESPQPPEWVVEAIRRNTAWDARLYAAASLAFDCRIAQARASEAGPALEACLERYADGPAAAAGVLSEGAAAPDDGPAPRLEAEPWLGARTEPAAAGGSGSLP